MTSICKYLLLSSVLLHGLALPFPTRRAEDKLHASAPTRVVRDSESSLVQHNTSFVVNPVASGICYGGDHTGLGNTDLRLEYRDNASDFQWVEIAANISTSTGVFTVPIARNSTGSGCVEFRLVQEEHGGGECNCWTLSDVRADNATIIWEESVAQG